MSRRAVVQRACLFVLLVWWCQGFVVVNKLHPRCASPAVLLPRTGQPIRQTGSIEIPRFHFFMSFETESMTEETWEEEEDATADEEEGEDGLEMNSDTEDNGEDEMYEEYQRWLTSTEKSIEALEKRFNSLQRELQKAETVEQTIARANLLTTYRYMFTPGVKSVIVADWENDGQEIELVLDPKYDSVSEEVDALFEMARKVKRGSKVIGTLLTETSKALQDLQEIKGDFEFAFNEADNVVNVDLLRLIQDRLLRTSRSTGFTPPHDPLENSASSRPNSKRERKPAIGTPASNLRKLKSPAGCTILVGRNRRGNEYLTFNIARGDDIWMHARGYPGAHVLVQQRRGDVKASDDCLQLAANLAAFYSDARTEKKASVTLCEPKHLLKPRGAPLGAVSHREELKVLIGFPDDVPEEYILAREASGQSTEYRAADKAKLRKRNKQAVLEQKAKRKAKAKSKKVY